MANSEQVINIDINTNGTKEATKTLTELGKTVQKLSGIFSKVFAPEKVLDYFKSSVQSGGELEKELLVLRLALGKLKAAVGDAAAPLGAVFIPIVQKAVWAATRMVKAVSKVIGALFGYDKAARSTASAQKALASANKEIKKSLVNFDEINQLNTAEGETVEITVSADTGALTPQLQGVVDKILSLLEPLKNIDFSPAVAAFGRLKEGIEPINQALFAGLEWAWRNLLVPLAAWTIEDLLPVFLNTLASALGVLNAVIVALQPAADWLWKNFLQPIAQWTGELIIRALESLRKRLDGIAAWVSENREWVQKIAVVAGAIALINTLLSKFNLLSGTSVGVLGSFGGSLGGLMNPLSIVTGGIQALSGVILLLIANWVNAKDAAIGVWNGIQSVWGGVAGWFRSNLFTPLTNGFKGMINGIIGFLNAMLAGVVSGINGIVNAVNKLSFTVPNWIPGIGGKTMGFNLKSVKTPQIPYLAKGAVLPANKPFMAVVGDQKHGTNVEAPLDVIKQAVAEVLGGQQDTVVRVNFTGNLAQLARVLKPEIDIENRRRGGSLVKGVAL